ncbi:2-succinyl-6-hydroxy-2,4-cyclohexadiene-1-carboxylate synthase [Halobacillus fulvus]|nr:2-succinyl-6-hydroxy-2,4-cyclohexadiene-1-carboxylate synthase [Halobacillus fulvus]
MYKQVNNRTYWIEDHGEGPVLLLLHGFTGSGSSFDEMIRHLQGSYRIIRIDLPGHGKTGVTRLQTMEDFCRDLHDLLEQMSLERVSLLGYSMGGRTALSFAILYPGKVERLLLESASPGLATSREQIARQAKDTGLIELIERKGIEAFTDYWEKLPLFKTQEQLPEDVRENLRRQRLNQNQAGLIESLRSMGTGVQPSWWGDLSTIRTPVWLVTGEYDAKFIAINEQMRNRLPEVEWVQVQSAGHTVHLENPREYAKIVDRFMVQ